MTTSSKPYPTRVKVLHQRRVGYVVIDQLRTIDKARTVKILGHLKDEEVRRCKKVIQETFVD